MRLEKELGALNRDIIAIKEKWKIALNIDSKKVAIERLITMRKKLRDNNTIKEKIQQATEEEKRKMATIVETPSPVVKTEVQEKEIEQPTQIKQEVKTSKQLPQQEDSKPEPTHLTVSWLKNRIKNRRG